MIWQPLRSDQQFLDLLQASKQSGLSFGIFKHSTRCGISRMALKQFEKEWEDTHPVELYYLDLLTYRSVSNLIEKTLGVYHESPQFILVEKGEVMYNGSHSFIDVKEAISSLAG